MLPAMVKIFNKILKYLIKVRFACEIKLILQKCVNMMRTSGKNVAQTMLFS